MRNDSSRRDGQGFPPGLLQSSVRQRAGRDGASCSRVSDCSIIRVSFADGPGPIKVVFELGILTIRHSRRRGATL